MCESFRHGFNLGWFEPDYCLRIIALPQIDIIPRNRKAHTQREVIRVFNVYVKRWSNIPMIPLSHSNKISSPGRLALSTYISAICANTHRRTKPHTLIHTKTSLDQTGQHLGVSNSSVWLTGKAWLEDFWLYVCVCGWVSCCPPLTQLHRIFESLLLQTQVGRGANRVNMHKLKLS